MKLGGASGAKPFFLRVVPAEPVAKTAEPATKDPEGEMLGLPDADGLTPETVRHLLTATSRLANLSDRKDGAREGGPSRGDVPVFYRPSSREPDGEPVCGNLGDFPRSRRVVFPLPKGYFGSYGDTWGAPRPQGGHEGTDLMSPTGTPEFAITDGTLVPVSGANENGWNTLGGYTVMLEAAYDAGPVKKGDLFYYAHLDRESALPIGTKVRAGQRIGAVGDTGEGREVTRGKFPSHLHLGWYDTGSAGPRTNLESGAMDPYPLLLWLEENGGTVTGGTDAAYCEAPQGSVPDSSGTSPDLDTGDDNDARPSPIVGKSRYGRGSLEPGPDNRPDEKNESSESNQRARAKDGGSNEGAGGRVENDSGTEDGRGGSSALGGSTMSMDQTSSPSEGDNSRQVGIRSVSRVLLLSQPDRISRQSYATILVDALRKAKKDGQDAGTPDRKKQKKQKNPPDPPEPKELEKGRSAARTGSTPARPAPDERKAGRPPVSRKTP